MGRGYNVGVAMGFNGVAAIDIDTNDPAICAAIRRAEIPASNVTKCGQKGRTDFYNIAGQPTRTCRFYGKDGKIIVELLSSGTQSVIPPSHHPDTGNPYKWLTPRTLLETRAEELTEAPSGTAERLKKALGPWLKDEPPKPERPQHTGPLPVLTERMRKRHRAWALKGLDQELAALAAKQKPGRNRAVFDLVRGFGRFFHHGIIDDAELISTALQACETNGLNKENGQRDTVSTIDRALRYVLGDVLEDLPDREKPNAKATKASNKKVEPNPDGPLPNCTQHAEHWRTFSRTETSTSYSKEKPTSVPTTREQASVPFHSLQVGKGRWGTSG